MPEIPDLTVYMEAMEVRILQQPLQALRLNSPFLLRTAVPTPEIAVGHTVIALRRIGKRIAIGFDNDAWFLLHLMIAGRLHWRRTGCKLAGKNSLAALDFADGALVLTEAGSHKRASLRVVGSTSDLAKHDPGGIEVQQCDFDTFQRRLRQSNHTLKRTLTDPRLLSGIGNAYSDEILHAAQLSPVKLNNKLTADECRQLYTAIRKTMDTWSERLRQQSGDEFPQKVTAFRPEMAVHGKFGKPCPRCATTIQRIQYANSETNYCPRCQTGGKLLADRALSKLLKNDWPRTVEELEKMKASSA